LEISHDQLAAALDAISEDIESASNHFDDIYHGGGDPYEAANAEWRIQLAYSKLLVLAELLKLPQLRADIYAAQNEAASDWTASARDPDGEPHLKSAFAARRFHRTLQSVYLTETSQTVTKDLEAIVRDSLYAITDERIYGQRPMNEADVHLRIQGILKCVFPDLLNKPPLSKPIKNFEPDTGIPSIRTIIEYKFISEAARVPVVADEILADTRGYISEKWRSFLYVIYETERFRAEADWRSLLRECGIGTNVSVLVLNGASVDKSGKKASGVTRVRGRSFAS